MNAERFWAKVDVRSPDECWEWTACRFPGKGYGYFWHEGRGVGAHRVAFLVTRGRWPLVARHRCDNPPCCNPAHIDDGTHALNAKDRVVRGRSASGERHPLRRNPTLAARGEQMPHAKLSASAVRELRRRRALGATQEALAREFNVSRWAVRRVLDGATWRHVA